MEFKGLNRLEQIRQKNTQNPNWINKDLYRLLYKEDMYVSAYEKIKRNYGALTTGTTKETFDGFSRKKILTVIETMQNNQYEFKPARRILIPKAKKGSFRPLGIPNPEDKLVQEVIRMILEAIYEGTFVEESHGFRPNKSCHTALRQVKQQFDGVKWVVEGDIEGAYDNINHRVLLTLLRRRIKDERFIQLIDRSLKAGYLYGNRPILSVTGTPQGSIVSPILANIYFHELDLFVKRIQADQEEVASATKRKTTKDYNALATGIQNQEQLIADCHDPTERRKLVNKLRRLKRKRASVQAYETKTIPVKIYYVRYADDWVIGVNGPKIVAEQLKTRVAKFMMDTLKLRLSAEKTKLTYLKTTKALFLGYELVVNPNIKRMKLKTASGKMYYKRTTGHFIKLDAPIHSIVKRLYLKGFCDSKGKPISKSSWVGSEDRRIVQSFSYVLNGLANYYSGADNQRKLIRIQYILQMSCACTLSHKHKSTLKKVFEKHGTNLTVKRLVDGKVKETSLPLRKYNKDSQKWLLKHTHQEPFEVFIARRTRSKLSENCCICGSNVQIEMHHIKNVRKAKDGTGFNKILGIINRKQIPVCRDCHLSIHNGKYDGKSLSDFAEPDTAIR